MLEILHRRKDSASIPGHSSFRGQTGLAGNTENLNFATQYVHVQASAVPHPLDSRPFHQARQGFL